LKIATFNINNVNRRLTNLIDWLKAANPDIVCLQELKAEQENFPQQRLSECGYNSVWVGERTWNGVAILARSRPVLTAERLSGDLTDTQSRYIEAAVAGILVACVYAPNGNPQPGPKFDYKLSWLRRLNARAAKLLKANVAAVIAGDFNVVPTPFDIYPSTSWDKDALVQPKSRAAFKRLIDQGWTDSIRSVHPDKPMFTFWDYKRDRWPRDAGLRLDHLLLSPMAASSLKAAGVDREVRGRKGASDHAPAWIVIARA